VGARTGDNAFVEEMTHETEWQAIGGVSKRVLIEADLLEH